MMKHTPEPWQQRDDQTTEGWITIIGNVDGEYIDGKPHCTYDVIARCEDEYGERLPNVSANAARIVACVNALKGMNPATIPMLVEAARRWKVARQARADFPADRESTKDFDRMLWDMQHAEDSLNDALAALDKDTGQ